MANKIYVGGLPYSYEDADLQKMFDEFGKVTSANIIKDKFSGRSKGFGFVEFEEADGVKSAIDAMNGKEVDGRNIVVDEARPMRERS